MGYEMKVAALEDVLQGKYGHIQMSRDAGVSARRT